MRLSQKIMKVMKFLEKEQGITREWLKNNSYFVEWHQDAKNLEKYIDMMTSKESEDDDNE